MPAVKTLCMSRNGFSHHPPPTTVRRRRLDAPYRLLVTDYWLPATGRYSSWPFHLEQVRAAAVVIAAEARDGPQLARIDMAGGIELELGGDKAPAAGPAPLSLVSYLVLNLV